MFALSFYPTLMKSHPFPRLVSLASLFAFSLPIFLCAEIEFVGIFRLGQEPAFSLVDTGTGARSGWIEVGQTFQGHRVEKGGNGSRGAGYGTG